MDPGHYVSAYGELICEPGGVILKLPVVIERLVSGNWVEVASGTGSATYGCNGSTEYEYRAVGYNFDAACG